MEYGQQYLKMRKYLQQYLSISVINFILGTNEQYNEWSRKKYIKILAESAKHLLNWTIMGLQKNC